MNPGFKLLTTFLVCILLKQEFTFKLVMSVDKKYSHWMFESQGMDISPCQAVASLS